MLTDLFPKAHRRYSSLLLLGSTMEEFVEFLIDQGYSRGSIRQHVRTALLVDRRLRKRGCRRVNQITHSRLRACVSPPQKKNEHIRLAATVRVLESYLAGLGVLSSSTPPSPIETLLMGYAAYLSEARGLAASTIKLHLTTVSQFLKHIGEQGDHAQLRILTTRELEGFVRAAGRRVGRGRMQHIVAQLRSYLRFLAGRGETARGLDTQIDTPRMYRGEQLPRSLPWQTVSALLASVDRSTPIGVRDYAILLLIATYGLRGSEVAGLKLDNVQWRTGLLCVSRPKTATSLLLPLTDAVGESLVAYLRCGRPVVSYREIFVRHRAPAGALGRCGVNNAFQAWAKRSGLRIPFHGPHCLRHSYAVHLLRQGVSLKTIGDLLGHRSPESTCVYLRLDIEDLRDVALSLPVTATQEVQR
ncbi:MAG: site-specific integrase [Candidatus Binatia bacterium]